MKRSSHVALLVGGLSVAGVSAYAMMPVRQECKPVNPPAAAATPTPGAAVVIQDGKPVGAAPAAAPQQQNCRRTRWFNHTSTSSSGRSGGMYVPGWSSRGDNRSSSNSVGLAPSRQANRSSTSSRSTTSSSSRSTTTSRGGFGSTSSSVSRGSSS
ncbi:hypothetical protein GJW-30_1_02846 [Variibacter gotjawalensis]|uniref:Uncharacterized protein n=1 Tax=Variibacter gotjawalensis TaxID=1333996 RepID=A0A0S3PWK2_9BRAD|nr:hypothetical protein [Variibacter gotjawalensis]NIK46136.1 hypothetical protein [Variibacter gotjawalensis]RZS48054.1 hypothetical protein EV661_0449 [Variibacter gotjawalensis]BAT60310.1 hypothetical protein GJW-30_1_02846 [Variibacter gotjawalensis]